MKKLILLMMIIAILSVSLYADSEFISAGFSGGYTTVQSVPTFGFNTKYQGVFDISNSVSLGVGINGDFSFAFSSGFSATMGTILGPVLSIAISDRDVLNLTVGPGFYGEFRENKSLADDYYFFGIGPAADIYYTHFFGDNRDTGISVGAFTYSSLYDFTKNTSCPRFHAAGYVALTLRFSDNYDSISYNHFPSY